MGRFFIVFVCATAIWIGILSVGNWYSGGDFLITFGTLGILSAASLITGGFFGFLFGIPRSLSTPGPSFVQPNTNLEQISDWLTKILVGVGLTQIGTIFSFMKDLPSDFDKIIPDSHLKSIVYVATMVALFFSGFLWGYFESRTSLMAVFDDWARPGLIPPGEIPHGQ
jgi:hypothetical protein